jgi:hypothetical protein
MAIQNHFDNGVLSYVEQDLERLKTVFAPFEERITHDFGFNINFLVNIFKEIELVSIIRQHHLTEFFHTKEFKEFEEEEIIVKDNTSEIDSGDFNFMNSSNEDSTNLTINKIEEIELIEEFINEDITESKQALPLGTTDLTLPRFEQAEPEVSLPFETSVINEEKKEKVIPAIETESSTESSLEAASSLYKQIEKQYPTDVERQYFHLKLL